MAINNVLVHAVGPNGFYVEHVKDDPEYDPILGSHFSAIFVFTSATGQKPAVGDRIDITMAKTATFWGQRQLTWATFAVKSQNNLVPAPELASATEMAADGNAVAKALEALLVRVENVDVINGSPTAGAGDNITPLNEVEITGGLRVNDYFNYVMNPLPPTGATFDYVVGLLHYVNNLFKIEPRDANDVSWHGGTTSSSGNLSSSTSGQPPSSSATSGQPSSSGGTATSGGSSSTSTENVVDCGRTLTPPTTGTCTVVAGGAALVLEGTVLTETQSLRGGQVVVDANGIITCAACDCSSDANFTGATRITCANGVISPTLINTHDHLTFDQNAPYDAASVGADPKERYEHRHDWRKGFRGHTRISSPSLAEPGTRIAELRQLLAGSTAVNGSGGVAGLLRNLDKGDMLESGLTGPPVAYETFPLGDNDGIYRDGTCTYPSIDTPESVANANAYTPHVSEGIDAEARNEFSCLSLVPNDVVMAKSAFIHGVGLNAMDLAAMGAEGTAIIWSPRSNISLYGHTAQVTLAHLLGVELALGTDWTLSGSVNMLRELACADQLNSNNFGGFFSDQQLWAMATVNAANVLAVSDFIGSIRTGKLADIAIFAGDAPAGTGIRKDWRAVITAEPKHVALVLRKGKVMTGDANVVQVLPDSAECETLDMCGVQKRVCAQRETKTATTAGLTVAQIKAAASAYDVFFCGTPPNEPTCVPSRPPEWKFADGTSQKSPFMPGAASVDTDGDGIPDLQDNCPDIFNPVRPVDGNAQANFDGDDLGDVCDPCPLNAFAFNCTPPDPNDQDADGIPNASDNCPTKPNSNQSDRDLDLKGDVCDACPDTPNPGVQACSYTIYDLKQNTTLSGAVGVRNVLVTAVGKDGYFIQHQPLDPSYNAALGSHFSAIYVYGSNKPAVGDRIDISTANVSTYYGQRQLSGAAFTVLSSNNPTPAPELVDATALLPDQAVLAWALEGVIIGVQNVTVTSINPTPGGGDAAPTNEFEITGGIRVNDFIYLVSPMPALGEVLAFVNGVFRYANNNFKIEPRSANDVGTQLTLVVVEPAQSAVRVGESVTLSVRMSRAVQAETVVSLSTVGTLLSVPASVTVTAGQSTASFPVQGVSEATGATVSATYEGVTKTATVDVLSATAQPHLSTFTSSPSTVAPGGTATLTVTLDMAAPSVGTVVAFSMVPELGTIVPNPIIITGGQVSGTATFTAGATTGPTTITVALGTESKNTTITVSSAPTGKLVINEVDYDMVGDTESAEYVEIFNGTNAEVALDGMKLVLFNGNGNASYASIALSGTLQVGGYAVVASPGMSVTTTALVFRFSAVNVLQNGSPDGVGLIDATGKLVDALSYEGPMTAATYNGQTYNLVEGTALPLAVADSNTATGSLCRMPNGADTDNAATDWIFCATLTPGAANQL